jgi:hypothetical protein
MFMLVLEKNGGTGKQISAATGNAVMSSKMLACSLGFTQQGVSDCDSR